MRTPSSISIASREGSSRLSNRRQNRLALAVVFMHHSQRAAAGQSKRCISKNALQKATETVCMTNNGKRVAWVTGGGTGIGESAAEHLADDGWIAVISGRRQAELDRAVATTTTTRPNTHPTSLPSTNTPAL